MKKLFLLGILFFAMISFYSCKDDDLSNDYSYSTSSFNLLSPSEFKQKKQKKNYYLIDIRTEKEVKNNKLIKGTDKIINFYDKNFLEKLDKLERNKNYLIYCNRWNRTEKAMEIMKWLGFNWVAHLETWIQWWKAKDKKVVTCEKAEIC